MSEKITIKMTIVEQSEKVVLWLLTDCGGKDLWKRCVLNLVWNSECAMEGESGE